MVTVMTTTSTLFSVSFAPLNDKRERVLLSFISCCWTERELETTSSTRNGDGGHDDYAYDPVLNLPLVFFPSNIMPVELQGLFQFPFK